jgi:hypothetical protein
LKLNGIHRPVVYSDDVNLLDGDTNIIKRTAEAVFDAGKGVAIVINTEKTMYMSRHQNVGQNGNIKIINKYLKMRQTLDIWERL